jgi:hypothetical protein
MAETSGSRTLAQRLTGGELPIILLAAVAQGLCLYALHSSVERSVWPSTEPGLLIALYAVAVFVTLTLQLLARHVRARLTWLILAALVAFYLLVGWHHGAQMFEGQPRFFEAWFSVAFIVSIQWLLLMPFVQARLIDGHWRSRYELLFSSAWNNKLLLAEAGVFTGFFWLLLFLWAQLFEMLGVEFFSWLFREPIFIYPVTSIVFGVALQLIGSVERLTKAVLEQLLSVLKWLALLAALILVLFTVALVFELPRMISIGDKAIAAVWLLWLIAVVVLLVNAAYRDGSVARPYPRAIGLALRCALPLTVIIALVAVYALWLRVDQYGVTVSRFWGWIVAGAALLYCVGYALAARHREHWMRSVAGVNVLTALYLIAVLTLALTPVLSPYRIAADSQLALILAEPGDSSSAREHESRLNYLRFDSGKYGRDRLAELGRIENHPRAEELRRDANAAIARQNRFALPQLDDPMLLAQMTVQPRDRALDPALAELVAQEVRSSGRADYATSIAGVFVDLDEDGTEEFAVLMPGRAVAFQNEAGGWRRIGDMSYSKYEQVDVILARIRAGNFGVEASQWRDLVVGDVRYRVSPDPR